MPGGTPSRPPADSVSSPSTDNEDRISGNRFRGTPNRAAKSSSHRCDPSVLAINPAYEA
jgi:hypothetical protein